VLAADQHTAHDSAADAIPEPERLTSAAPDPRRQRQLLALQRRAGNQAVQRLLTQRRIGQPGSSTDTPAATVQRCGGTVHDGCACASSGQEIARSIDGSAQAVVPIQRKADPRSDGGQPETSSSSSSNPAGPSKEPAGAVAAKHDTRGAAAGPAVEAPKAPANPAPAGTPATDEKGSDPAAKEQPGAGAPGTGGGDAGHVLASLAQAAPSSFASTLSAARTAGQGILTREKADLASELPEIQQPTGLPTGAEPVGSAPPGAPPPAGPPAVPTAAGSATPSAETRASGSSRPLPGNGVDTSAHAPSTTAQSTAGNEGGGWWDWLVGRVQGFVRQLPTQDPGVSTSAGPRPQVDLTGEADPSVPAGHQQASTQHITDHQTHADEATAADFGEQRVVPTVAVGRLLPTLAPAPPPALATGLVGAAPALPAEYKAQFDQDAAPQLHQPASEQLSLYQQEQATYKRTAQEAQKVSTLQIDDETARARTQQQELRQEAHADVGGERKRWLDENRKIREDFSTSASTKRQELDRQAQEKVATADRETQTKLSEAETTADAERKKAESEAAEKKKEAQAKPKSFWESVKDGVSSVFDTIKSAVNSIFDRLRQAVKGIIDAAKAAVRGLIDMARKAVVGLIQAFGEVLKGMVSVALAAFPAAAAKARAWIDARVKSAVTAVNRAADALKRAAEAILDTLGKVIDAALSLVQAAFVSALGVLETIAKAAVDGMEALAKLAAWLKKNASFLEGAKKIMDNPDQVIEAIKAKLSEMIAEVPEKATAKLKEIAAQFGGGATSSSPASASAPVPVVQRDADTAAPAAPVKRHVSAGTHLDGIGACLEKGIEHLKAHWWDELKKVGWNLLWPWPAVWGDIKAIGSEIKAGFDDARHLRISKAIDRMLTIDQKLNSILGNLYGWFFIASVLVGTIIGAFFGGAGALPGALAGAAFAGEVGEALVIALIATEGAVILKGIADLVIGNDSAKEDQADYEKIGGSLLTIAITGAMMIVGEIAASLAKAIWEGVVGLLRGKGPEVDVKVEVKPGDAEPKVEADPGAKSDTAAPDAASQKGVAAERTTPDGHTIKVLEDGRVFICTTCEQLNFKYGEELKGSTELKDKWDAANAEADPKAKADKVEALQKELADARKKSMSGESPEVKVGKLDAMIEQARQALGRLKETLRNKGGKLASSNGSLKGKIDGDLPQLDRQLSDFQKDAGVAKDMKDPASMDEYREKLDDVRAKADELNKEVNDSVPDEPDKQPADKPADDAGGGDRTLRVPASRPEARVIQNPADTFPRRQALAIDEVQVTMNDLYRDGAKFGDGSTAYMAMLEQAKAGVGRDPIKLAGDTLHAGKCSEYSKGLTDILADKGPDLPPEAQGRIKAEVGKMQEAVRWADAFKKGENPPVPSWAKPWQGELLGL